MKFLFLLILLLPATSFAATDIINDGTLSTSLLVCYDLDETTGTRVDQTANAYDLTANNTPGNAAGKEGNAVDLEHIAVNNTSGSYLSRSTAANLETTGDLSIATWVQFETTPGLFWLVDKKSEAGLDFSMYALFTNTNTLNFRSTNGSASSNQDDSVSWSPSTATWYHVVLTRTSAGVLKFYVDGSQTGTDQTGYNGALSKSGSRPFHIGRYKLSGAGNIRNMDGLMDVTAVWSKVLTGTEITDLYNGGTGIPCDAEPAGSTPQDNTYFEIISLPPVALPRHLAISQ